MINVSPIVTVTFAVAAVLATYSPAKAQDAQNDAASEGGLLEEIVVTAQRREQQIQDVPIAISAFSNEQLAALGATETLDLIRFVPNLIGSNNTGLGTANVYSLRALNNTESIATFDPPVGTYVDEVFIARQNANNFAFFDVDRVEVLRGPQGTLFGRNTTGGAISIVLRKPAEEFGGYIEGGFGQFGMYKVRGSVDVPLSEQWLTKFSMFMQEDEGYVGNPTTGEDGINATDKFGVRAAIRYLPSDTTTWDFAIDYVKDEGANMLNFDSSGGPQVELEPLRPGLAPSSAAAANVAANCNRGQINRSRFACTGLRSDRSNLIGFVTGDKQYIPLGNEVKAVSVSSNLGFETSIGAVNVITGYRDMSQDFSLDFFNNPNPQGGFTIANEGKHEQLSQEIKLVGKIGDNITHTSGVYYFEEDNTTDFADLFFIGAFNLTAVLEDRILESKTEAIAAYSQWDFNFADAFTLTVGGRFTDEQKSIDYIANANPRITTASNLRVTTANILSVSPTNPAPQLVGNPIPVEKDISLFTPRVALKYELNDDINFFVSGTRGFKSGGWNARGTNPNEILPFDAEKTWSYEAGLRSDLLDGRMRLNVTLFQVDTEDFQLPSAFIRTNGSIAFITQNFADLKNRGAEVELFLAPTDDLTLFAFLGVQDAEYENLGAPVVAQQQRCLTGLASLPAQQAVVSANCSAGIITPSGGVSIPVRAPDTYTVGGNYKWRLGERLTLTPNVLVQFVGSQAVGTNNSPVALVDSYSIWNASLQLADSDAGWTLSAQCDNCADRSSIASTLAELPYIQAPRTWSVNFRYNFGARQ